MAYRTKLDKQGEINLIHKFDSPTGVYCDRIITRDGQVRDLGWCSNIIVDRCRYLLASFMKNEKSSGTSLKAEGIRLLAIGRGEEKWDTAPPPQALPAIQQLVDPNPFKIEVKPKQIKYLDDTRNIAQGPTHRIQVSIVLDPGVPPLNGEETAFPLREFGLFGRFGNKDYMIDYVRHPVIHKQADETLNRTIRLVF
jgi:hypothetical protein